MRAGCLGSLDDQIDQCNVSTDCGVLLAHKKTETAKFV